MTADSAIRTGTGRSPLADWAGPLGGLAPAVHAVEQPMLTQLTLRLADPGAAAAARAALGVDLPGRPCTFTRGPLGEVEVLWMGPDEYLVLAPPGSTALAEGLRTALDDAAAAVVDVSAQRTTLALAGPLVRDVLAHGCAIDLHPAAAPTGTCVQTLLARAGVVLLVRDAERAEFGLLVRSSFAGYLAAWLLDASLEYREGQVSQ
ncbi:sarcosine oxidase subunit gamma [Amycolatopsis aidingensis]|uniref:sarcosine oxidase subunit gamma n=1 Tax=Amycolatopsis aidingensis TaxID=2842453 RepID=UPI001E4D5558|nr:sarcosine oxidase subunit gamma family protein [Amycolatopsis aidingensis]